MDEFISVRGASQHNLKNLDIDFPKRSFTVVTGPSGSGKSSLALDTIFAEGQRRYVESLSTYAKQFLNRIEKPKVQSIEGISPAVALEQKNPTRSSRSTVGTATEVYGYMRLLWARIGTTYCPDCGDEIRADSVTSVIEELQSLPESTRIQVTFPLGARDQLKPDLLIENLKALGYVRLLVDGVLVDLGDPNKENLFERNDLSDSSEILVLVDRLVIDHAQRDRLADSISICFKQGMGEAIVIAFNNEDVTRLNFSEYFKCEKHPEVKFVHPTPKLFSFNNSYGCCPNCTGFGATLEYDEDLIISNPKLSVSEGAVDPWSKPRYHRERKKLQSFLLSHNISPDLPWGQIPQEIRGAIIEGSTEFRGVIPFLKSRERKRYKPYIRIYLRRYQATRMCMDCEGARVRKEALCVRIAGYTIAQATQLSITDLEEWVSTIKLSEMQTAVAATILVELQGRLTFLLEVGLGYLSLDRQVRTLSGGESQRIGLANSLGSQLVDTLYVLDEPTVGLHPKDIGSLLNLLGKLRDVGNTVLVVEHDSLAIMQSDYVVELGPGSGREGGDLVFEGTPQDLCDADSVTGNFLSGKTDIALPKSRRPASLSQLSVYGATLHNLVDVDVKIPLKTITVVTGVSGSGKSTLVHDIIYKAVRWGLKKQREISSTENVKTIRGIEGTEAIDEIVLVDQTPIGRTPRSNPATYIKVWGEIRKILAVQPLSQEREYTAGHFSFNVSGGRCDECKGAGQVKVEMIFMPDIYVVCDSCRGYRYRSEVLEVTLKGLNVAQILDLTIDEAIQFFAQNRKIGKILWILQEVGIGYLRLGQPANTLSGGESQRLKIARELTSTAKGKSRNLNVLDEPTTGLSGADVKQLLVVLNRLVDLGNSVLMIEHNIDVIKIADWVIDMGPGAGPTGGRVVAEGTPEAIVSNSESITGEYLHAVLPV